MLPLNDITAFYGTANDVIIASKNLSFGLMAGNEYKFDNEIAIFGSHLEEHTHTHAHISLEGCGTNEEHER